jgi:N-acetylmuramoyl-L-alanine amidase
MSLIIDAGHQGTGLDPGAVGGGIIEADMNLDITLYQYKRFQELGVPVKLTRNKSIAMTNTQRTNLVKNSGMKHCISNHINAGGGDGFEVIVSKHSNQKWAELIKKEMVAVGQNFRRIFTRLTANGNDYYFMNRDTGSVETIIMEYGFLDSKKDDIIQLKNDWKKYAEAVVKAYCLYAGYTYKAVGEVAKPVVKKSLYTDVDESTFNYEGIKKATELGLVTTYSNGSFKPDLPVTRSQMATISLLIYEKLKG